MVLRGSLGSEYNLDKEVKLFHGKNERTERGESKSEAKKKKSGWLQGFHYAQKNSKRLD